MSNWTSEIPKTCLAIFFLDAFDMAAAEALDLAAELEIAADRGVVEDAEAVDDGGGAAGHPDDVVRGELHVGVMPHGEDHRVGPLEGARDVLLDPEIGETLLVAEETRPGMARRGVAILLLQLPPALDVQVMDADLRTHFGKLADKRLGAAVAGVADVLTVRGAQHHHLRGSDDLAHVAQGVPDKLGDVEGARVVDVDRKRRHLEDVVFEAHQRVVRPDAEAPVLRQAVAPDPRPGEDHVRVRGAHLDRLDHLDQIDAVALGEEAPLVEEGEDRCPVRVLYDLAGLAFNRKVWGSGLEI